MTGGAWTHQVPRFVLVGAVNTIATTALFVALAEVMDPRIAYTIVFALGLAFTTVATSRFVFGADLRTSTAVRFVAWYGLTYLVGLLVVHVASKLLHLPNLLTAVASVAVTAPLNFLGGRLVFARRQPQPHLNPERQT